MRKAVFARFFLLFLLISFCVPFTAFEEGRSYIADTENELVHYYLTPLPDNGEACAAVFLLSVFLTASVIPLAAVSCPGAPPAHSFFHPPEQGKPLLRIFSCKCGNNA